MRIRQAISADLDAVKRCAEEAYAKYVSRMGTKPAPMIADFAGQIGAKIVHVIVDDGSVLGFIVLYPRDDHIHVENVAVFPERGGRGIGGKLLAFAEHEARRLELPAVELYTNEKMTENLSLYRYLGYQEIGRRTEAGFSRVYFRKDA
ncbi:MAG: GNAT family N-acetyltransferase [Proteobacteria bacterium]|nr:GNAT family N-acetyltransferase [Pseudomonadota bacterium]